MATLQTKVSISKDILFHQVEDEMVLLNLATGRYFSLDDVGTRMWTLITENGDLNSVHQALLKEYQVEPQQLEHDLLELTDKLTENGLLQVVDS